MSDSPISIIGFCFRRLAGRVANPWGLWTIWACLNHVSDSLHDISSINVVSVFRIRRWYIGGELRKVKWETAPVEVFCVWKNLSSCENGILRRYSSGDDGRAVLGMWSSKYMYRSLRLKFSSRKAAPFVGDPTVRIGIIAVSSTTTPISIEEIGIFYTVNILW